ANMEEISAEMKNGILTVFLHKTEKKVSKIEVK
ncbi:MAG: Hsp20 family protein, partial [Saprospiraceae bacterium]|nr:Hsp20 family protein [Saprospiraceae bacterium]